MSNYLESILFSQNEDWRVEFWCKPVDFETFVTSKEHMRLPKLTPRQLDAVYSLIGKDPLKVFSKERKKHILVCLWGKGSGKDYVASIIQAYIFYILLCMRDPHAYFGGELTVRDSSLDILNIAPTAVQARRVYFTYFKSRIKNWNWLMDNFLVTDRGKKISKGTSSRLEIRITDTAVETNTNIRCLSMHSEAGNFEGFNVIFFLMDESSEFDDKFETVMDGGEPINIGKAELIYSTLTTSAMSRGLPWMGVIISFPRREDDFTIKKYQEGLDNPEGEMVVSRGCTWEFNPKHSKEPTFKFEQWDVPISFKPKFDADPGDARMKFCTIPPIILSRFFYSDERIASAVDVTIQAPLDLQDVIETVLDARGKPVKYVIKKIMTGRVVNKTLPWAIHIDLSISKDSTTMVIGHGEKIPYKYQATFVNEDGGQYTKAVTHKVVIDQIVVWEPKLKDNVMVSHINVDEILEAFTGLTGCRFVSYDQYQSQYVLEKGIRNGVDCQKENIKNKQYFLTRNYLHAGLLSFPKHEKLLFEITRLVWDGKRVDHTYISTKDIMDGVAGVTFAIAEGKAIGQDEFNFAFMPDNFMNPQGDSAKATGQMVLPKEALTGTYEQLNPETGTPVGEGGSKIPGFEWIL